MVGWFRWGSGDDVYIGLLRRRVPSGCTCLLCRIRGGDLALVWCGVCWLGAKLKAPCGMPDRRTANKSSQPCLEGYPLHRHRPRAGGQTASLQPATSVALLDQHSPFASFESRVSQTFRLSTSQHPRNGSHVSCASRLTFSLREVRVPSWKPPTSETSHLRNLPPRQ